MSRYSTKFRTLQFFVIATIFLILCHKTIIYLAIYIMYNYPHLPAELIETQLYKKISPKLALQKSKHDCEYEEILKSTRSILNWEVPRKFFDFSTEGLMNGSYVPAHCNPKFSVAIIVAYKDRQRQLDIFLPYIHNFLRKQNIHYRLYVVEQQDEKKFNKGILYNVGARTAIRDKFPCLILHDVDLLPLDESNLYACSEHPRHMSASVDKLQYILPYDYLTGGVLAIKSEQYVAVNGYSNRFERWGGEDDDFSHRLSTHKLEVVRYPRGMSRYAMLEHPDAPRNVKRKRIMRENRHLAAIDGLNSLPSVNTQVKNHRLFTLVGVQL